jgi:hypothetical protein
MTGGIDMSEKEKDKSKDSEGLQGAIKRFLRVKGGGSCCKVRIEEVEEEKTGDEAETTEKK